MRMALPMYSRVRLLTDKYQSRGVSVGAIGFIIEVYGDEAYEVEFSDKKGITIALIAIPQDEVELAEE
jgi:hypothetical protein